MKGEIRITGARREATTGPSASHWQVSAAVSSEGHEPFETLVAVWQPALDNFRDHSIILPNDLPEWVPGGHLEERVHWQFLNQGSDALQRPGVDAAKVRVIQTEIVEEFEVVEGDWNY